MKKSFNAKDTKDTQRARRDNSRGRAAPVIIPANRGALKDSALCANHPPVLCALRVNGFFQSN
jgi:hypothetical protein